jgi:bleomycin hydrolase
MNEIYNHLLIENFQEYYASKKYASVGPIKPTDFYEKYVKPYYNMDDKVCS